MERGNEHRRREGGRERERRGRARNAERDEEERRRWPLRVLEMVTFADPLSFRAAGTRCGGGAAVAETGTGNTVYAPDTPETETAEKKEKGRKLKQR